ncbi:MAG: hypothetical protein OIF50_05070 [Flavobacteriaceae bacterium]|nr:hypothetical protein [Flavobacteriaceae bacterium]
MKLSISYLLTIIMASMLSGHGHAQSKNKEDKNPDYQLAILQDNFHLDLAKSTFNILLEIKELNQKPSGLGAPIEIRIPRIAHLQLSFQTDLQKLEGSDIKNDKWIFEDNHPIYYTLLYKDGKTGFPSGSYQIIGIQAKYQDKTQKEVSFSLKASLKANSGGQTNRNNDSDSVRVTFQ